MVSDRQDMCKLELGRKFNVYFNRMTEKLLTDNQFDLEEAALEVDAGDSAISDGEGPGDGCTEKLYLTISDAEKNVMKLKNKK